MIDKQDLILLNIGKAKVISANTLVEVMGYKNYSSVTRDIAKLIEQGLVEELEWGNCPHCGEKLNGIEVKKASISLKLTSAGNKRVEEIKDMLKDLL